MQEEGRRGGSCTRWIMIGASSYIRYGFALANAGGRARLLGKNGFPALIQEAKKFKIKGKGHEVSHSASPSTTTSLPVISPQLISLCVCLCS